MAYSATAKALRRCIETKPDGARCRAWARWEADDQRCSSHAIRKRGKRKGFSPMRSKAQCTCGAYEWPHRPGSGLCRWPDLPIEVCETPAGTRSGPRFGRTAWGKIYGQTYVERMRSAVGDNFGTKTGVRRGRPTKASLEMRCMLKKMLDNNEIILQLYRRLS
jgi:hypothetical protein